MAAGSGPSWRGSASTPGRGNARSWRKPTASTAAVASPFRSRWFRAASGLITTAIAVTAITIFIFLIFVPGCSETQFALLVPAPYNNESLPPSPFAQQDREAFRDAFKASSISDQLNRNSSSAKDSAAAPGSSSNNPLFVYVTAMAGLTDRGALLYSMDSGPDEAEGAIPIEQLWKYLASQPPGRKKIVAIDLARGPVDDRWGQFVRPSVSRSAGSDLTLVDAAAAIPNLAVITSAAPGEVSWTSPVFARSVFAHFLVRALFRRGRRSRRTTARLPRQS